MKKVLFINPSKEDYFYVGRIHMGFCLLAQILSENGHNVKIIDYAYLNCLNSSISIPSIEDIIREFEPDIIGISVFSYLYDECKNMIQNITSFSNVPIILGGPHFSIFKEDFIDLQGVSYIVCGEAEEIILELVENARFQDKPQIINCKLPSADSIPKINLDCAYGAHNLNQYQIQLSRGCPFNCSFCNIKYVSGKKIRQRNLETCIDQIKEAKRFFPNIKVITITDDCPNFDKNRLMKFLFMFKEANIGCELSIDNVRFDLLDENIIKLYKSAGGQNMCLGVEHADSEVFEFLHKGENLYKIFHIVELIRKYDIVLGLCFVIGLPMDNMKKHIKSILLAKKLRPNYIFWNMCVPWKGTEVYNWYKNNGEIGEVRNFSTLIDPRANFKDPPCSHKEFDKYQRIRAWLMANMETHNYFQTLRDLKKIFLLSIKYSLYNSFIIFFFKYYIPNLFSRTFKYFYKIEVVNED